MSRTFLRQDTQVRNTDAYSDAGTMGSTLQSGATNLEDDLNALRTVARHLKLADTAGNWYDDLATVNSKKRGINALNTDLDDIETKKVLFREHRLADITVNVGENWAVLLVSGSQQPGYTAAVDSGSAEGALVASLPADVGSHSLNEIPGPDAIRPKNLVLIRDAATLQPIQSGGRDIFGLLQSESGVVDGDTFNDTTKQVQISFVIENPAGSDLIACPVADIEGKTFNYSYVRRVIFDNLPEYAFLTGAFMDESATAEITLDKAIDNQSGPATQTQSIDWRISDTFTLAFKDSPGTRTLFRISPAAAGDVVAFDVDSFNVANVNRGDFTNGVRFDSSGTAIDVGDVAGTISSAGLLALLSGGGASLRLNASGEFDLIDGNKAGSTFAGILKLSDTAAEWSAYETAFGEVSLLNAIVQAKNYPAPLARTIAVATANVNAGVNVTGAVGTPNLDAQLGDYSTKSFVNDVEIFLNGVLLRNAVGATHDVYPGDAPATGDLKFTFKIKIGDVITMIIV